MRKLMKKNKKGYSLIEILLGLTVIGSLSAMTYKLVLVDGIDKDDLYRTAAVEIVNVNSSIMRFTSENAMTLSDESFTGEVCDSIIGTGVFSASDGLGKINIPRIFSSLDPLRPGRDGQHPDCSGVAPVGAHLIADDIGQYPLSILIETGYLNHGHDMASIPGGGYSLIIRRSGGRGNRTLTSLLFSNDPIIRSENSDTPDWSAIGAMLESGMGKIGVVREAETGDIANGFTGTAGELAIFGPTSTHANGRDLGWWIRFQDFSLPVGFASTLEPGTIVAKSETFANSGNERIPLSGTGSMRTNLNLGGNKIEDALEAQIIGVRVPDQTCEPSDEGKLARFAGDVPGTVTGLLECRGGAWKNVAGYSRSEVFDITSPQPTHTNLIDNDPVAYFELIGPSSVFTVPPGVNRIHAKVIGGGGGGGCGGATYEHPMIPGSVNYKKSIFYKESVVTGYDDDFSYSDYSCAPTLFVPRTCSSTDPVTGVTTSWDCSYTRYSQCRTYSTTSIPISHNLMRLDQGHGYRAGGGGGGGGGYIEGVLNVNPGDEIRITAGEGGNGCNNFPTSWPFSAAGMTFISPSAPDPVTLNFKYDTLAFKNDGIPGSDPFVPVEWSTWGKPSALMVYRKGVFQYGLFGGGGVRGYWGQMAQYSGSNYFLPSKGKGGNGGMYGIAANTNGMMQKAVASEMNSATFWDSDKFGIIVGVGSIGYGLDGLQCAYNYVRSPDSNISEIMSCQGGSGAGSQYAGLWSVSDPAPPHTSFGSGGAGGGSGSLLTEGVIPGTMGSRGSKGAVFLRW